MIQDGILEEKKDISGSTGEIQIRLVGEIIGLVGNAYWSIPGQKSMTSAAYSQLIQGKNNIYIYMQNDY